MVREKIIPVSDYLLIEVETTDDEGSSLILNVANTVENRGIVKAIGDKVNTDEDSTKIAVGDKVLFSPGAGTKVTNSEDSDLLISVKHIIGIIREDK